MLFLARLHSERRLTPRRNRARSTYACLSFTIAVWMVVRIHSGTSYYRPSSHMPLFTGLSYVDVAMVVASQRIIVSRVLRAICTTRP